MAAQIVYLPTPRTDLPRTPGYYVERQFADQMPYAPVYRLYDSGGWLLGAQNIPDAAMPTNLLRLIPEVEA